MNVYAINFNTETFKIEADIHKIEYSDLDGQYKKLVELLDADGLDILDYNEDIAILVDDRGFEKKSNPIFRVITDDGITLDLAGKILFARNVENEFSTDIGSIKAEDIFYLRNNLNIQLLGVVRGE